MSIDPIYATQPAATPSLPTPSVMAAERSELLPRLSFRFVLVVVTLVAAVAFVLRHAWIGSPIAIAIIYSIATLAICFALHAMLFFIAWIPAVIGRDQFEDVNRGNPFSIDQLPPQVIPPRDPGT